MIFYTKTRVILTETYVTILPFCHFSRPNIRDKCVIFFSKSIITINSLKIITHFFVIYYFM